MPDGERMPQIAFVAWSRLSRRTRDLARELGAKLIFIPEKPPYLKAFRKTANALEELKPDIVLVQLPQGPLLWHALRLSKKLGFKVVADVHTGFIYPQTLKEKILNSPFINLLKCADLILAHNPPQHRLIMEKAKAPPKRIVTVYDPLARPPAQPEKPNLPINPEGYIILPASWAHDEPLDYIVREFLKAKTTLKLVVTGNPSRNPKLYSRVKRLAKNSTRILFTGYLPEPQYHWLLKHSRAVIAATTREYTMLSAAWEAITYKKPVILNRTATLAEIFGEDYPYFFNYRRAGSLAQILSETLEDSDEMEKAMLALQKLYEASRRSLQQLRETLGSLA
jgi:hypothetical protein